MLSTVLWLQSKRLNMNCSCNISVYILHARCYIFCCCCRLIYLVLLFSIATKNKFLLTYYYSLSNIYLQQVSLNNRLPVCLQTKVYVLRSGIFLYLLNTLPLKAFTALAACASLSSLPARQQPPTLCLTSGRVLVCRWQTCNSCLWGCADPVLCRRLPSRRKCLLYYFQIWICTTVSLVRILKCVVKTTEQIIIYSKEFSLY